MCMKNATMPHSLPVEKARHFYASLITDMAPVFVIRFFWELNRLFDIAGFGRVVSAKIWIVSALRWKYLKKKTDHITIF